MSTMREIKFPKNKQEQENIEVDGSIVIVGANGSGKTRLSVWVEENNKNSHQIYRIAAHRKLAMPSSTQFASSEEARNNLYNGHPQHKESNRNSKYEHKPNTNIQQDFDALMQVLFSDESEKSIDYKNSMKHEGNASIPSTKMDFLKEIWANVLPHLKIETKSNTINTSSPKFDISYNGEEMSDGERNIFYLIGQCLCAPDGAIVTVDEPESHIHPAIRNKLWDEIEKKRADCVFLYVTHDLEFAASRKNSKKICVTDFNGSSWNWFEVPPLEGIPEEVNLKIMGSRKPVLFIEGGKSSLDYKIYNVFYSGYTIIPRGPCRKVIDSTREFNKVREFHHIEAYGIIDRDNRSDQEVVKLKESCVFVLEVAEIENTLLSENLLRAVLEDLGETNREDILTKVMNFVFQKLDNTKEKQISNRVCHRLRKQFERNFDNEIGQFSIEKSFRDLVDTIDIKQYYEEAEQEINDAISDKNYNKVLKILNQKGLIEEVSKFFKSLPNVTYPSYVEKLMKEKPDIFIDSIKNIVPSLSKNLL